MLSDFLSLSPVPILHPARQFTQQVNQSTVVGVRLANP
jgi:hypothetical protein